MCKPAAPTKNGPIMATTSVATTTTRAARVRSRIETS